MYCCWWYYRALHIIIICTFTMWHTLVKSSLPPYNDQNHQRAYKMLLVRFSWVVELESVQSCLIMFLWHYWFQGGADDLLIFFFYRWKGCFFRHGREHSNILESKRANFHLVKGSSGCFGKHLLPVKIMTLLYYTLEYLHTLSRNSKNILCW